MPERVENLKKSALSLRADPTQSSRMLTSEEILELSTKAPHTQHGQMVTLSDGARFFRIEQFNEEAVNCAPETQHAMAMLLKGIANVADLVSVRSPDTKETYYFSHALTLDDIGKNESPYALGAQQIFLDTLFGDSDHHVVIQNGNPSKNSYTNVRSSQDAKQFYFFDFAMAYFEAFFSGKTDAREYIEPRLGWANQTEESRMEFKRLLTAMRARVEGSQGLDFITSVVEKSGVPMKKLFAFSKGVQFTHWTDGSYARHFQKGMLRRIDFMEEYLERTPVTPLPPDTYFGPLR